MGRREIIAATAGLLALTGFIGLGLHGDTTPTALHHEPSTSVDSSTTRAPTSTSTSAGARHWVRQDPSPQDTQPPVSVTIPVEPDQPPADAPGEAVAQPECGPTVHLTVLRVEGCPVNSAVDIVSGAVTNP